jgi:hypothetical protein
MPGRQIYEATDIPNVHVFIYLVSRKLGSYILYYLKKQG